MNPKPLIEHIEYLVSQDETELALKCFDLVPAYFRDNKNRDLEKLRSLILSKVLMPNDLCYDDRELPKSMEHSINFLQATMRGYILGKAVEEANEKNLIPYIVDFGPGDYCFAIGMQALGLKFLYNPTSFNQKSLRQIKLILTEKIATECPKTSPLFFVAYEIIEHLADISEIRQLHDRQIKKANKIFLSTPKYTFENGTQNWKTEGIHHRRAYTPAEFIQASGQLFPDRQWEFTDDPVMVLTSSN